MKLIPCLVQRQTTSLLFDNMMHCRFASNLFCCRSIQRNFNHNSHLSNCSAVPYKVFLFNTTHNIRGLNLRQISSLCCGSDRLHIISKENRLSLWTSHSQFHRKYAFSRKSTNTDHDEGKNSSNNDDAIADRHMMLRLTSENDLLSRCRNTYIMTLVALSALNLQYFPLTLTLSGVAVVTAELNLMFGTIYYLLNIFKLWKTQKISTLVFLSHLFWAILHFTLWSLILGFLLPSGRKLDEELRNYTGED
ncbi:hypothetical protein ACF0H5_003100 [Mactra antiquata]